MANWGNLCGRPQIGYSVEKLEIARAANFRQMRM
jgi:hypothetical protein